MRILITGSRHWTDRHTIEFALCTALQVAGVRPRDVTVVHGGAPGADLIAGELAIEYGCRVEVYLADWQTHGKAAGPIRNARMVALGADVCLPSRSGSRAAPVAACGSPRRPASRSRSTKE